MRFRLRYLHRNLDLTEGRFTVGRSSDSQLFLDDPLVSRQHAIIIVQGGSIAVEDLKSRNGVLVNGLRISKRTELRPGDRVLIGAQELTVVAVRGESSDDAAAGIGRMTLTRVPTQEEGEAGLGVPVTDPAAAGVDTEASTIRRVNAFRLLSGVAEKALALGRAEEAERLLSAPLTELVEASRAGQRLAPPLVDAMARFAAKLASSTAKGSWADYVVELYQAQSRPCPAAVIDELNNAVRRVSAIDLVRLRAYLAMLHEKQSTFGPAERFLLQRIEGLERLAALR
jgi:predicted component of type VI protein secretion system